MLVRERSAWLETRLTSFPALGGTLSSYTWICMILNFLQTRNPPILPSLHKKLHAQKTGTDSNIAGFCDDLDKLRDYGKANKESIGELLFNFFRRYAHDLDFETDVISVRDGRLISKEAKKWHLMQNNRLCVEEPFNTERNLGNTADDISFRGIHLELRRAFDLVSEAKLEECLEQYEFPAVEEKFWEKPTPKPAPVLRSRSQSQSSRSTRGGYQHRGGRQGQYKSSGRRASSAAATNKHPMLPMESLVQLPPGIRGRNYLTRDQEQYHAQQQAQQAQQAIALHEHFMLEMQALHEQEQKLRRLQRQNVEAAQLHGEPMERRGSQQYSGRNAQQRASSRHMPMSVPLRGGPFYQPWAYPQVPGTPIQQSVHTQPSSPSMKAAQPDLRRSLHRTNPQENLSASARSHSQPARPIPLAGPMHNAPALPLNSQSYLHYQQQLQHQQQLYAAMEGQNRYLTPEALMYQASRRLPIDHNLIFEDNVPKEYVGYWVNDSPPNNGDEASVSQLLSYQDLHSRVRGVPPNISTLRRNSRSPSPSPAMPLRDRSYSVRSASSAPIGPQSLDPRHIHAYGSRTGPVIVNGTDGWNLDEYPPMVDSSSHTTTISEATSGSDEQQFETPASGDIVTPFTGPENTYTMEDLQQYFNPQAVPDSARMPSLKQNGASETVRRHVPNQSNDTASSPNANKRSNRMNGNALGIQFGEIEYQRHSPKADPPPPPEHPHHAVNSLKTEISPITPTNGQFEKPAAPVPLLSPVREVRTPSPLGKRIEQVKVTMPQTLPPLPKKLDLHIPTFAELVRARQEKQNGAPTQRANGAIPSSKGGGSPIMNHKLAAAKTSSSISKVPTSPPLKNISSQAVLPMSPEKQTTQPQINGWQQQSSKKNKKHRSRPSSGQYFSGEPLPVNEAERKGG